MTRADDGARPGLRDLRAVVTGGGSGIGLATVRLLAAQGAAVAALDLEPGAASEPSGQARAPLGIRADVTDDSSVHAAIEEAADRFGGLDVLVNNAGVGAQGTVETNAYDEWRHVFDVNVLGIVRATRAALPHLRRSARAAIVNTCSVVATVGLPERALYGATKGAVYALTLAMAADHLTEGIRVNCVSPGTVDTPWVERLLQKAEDPAAARAALQTRQPLGRLVSADEVAAAIAYLIGPSAGAVTGSDLRVDGGLQGLRIPASLKDQLDRRHRA
jgi:NAD(P)-dependent dehydrogenase (short-subunit alcohol dehydrogenase family)